MDIANGVGPKEQAGGLQEQSIEGVLARGEGGVGGGMVGAGEGEKDAAAGANPVTDGGRIEGLLIALGEAGQIVGGQSAGLRGLGVQHALDERFEIESAEGQGECGHGTSFGA